MEHGGAPGGSPACGHIIVIDIEIVIVVIVIIIVDVISSILSTSSPP